MINITNVELENRLQTLPSDLKERLLMLDYEDNFKKIVNFKSIKDEQVIGDISYATQVVALGFASKQEMFELILEAIEDEEETKHIFEEIDRTILVPNNLQGAPETISTDNTKPTTEEIKTASNEQSSNQSADTTETAEDILKEIENPTPAPSTIPAHTPLTVVQTQTPTPVINTTPPTPEIVPTQTTTPASSSPTTTPTPPIQSSNPASMVMPTKEDILNGKLTEPSAQPLKSTYYKIDPYREQTK
jgi:hypothetical protein